MSVTRDIGANAATIGRAIEFAAAERADVLLTPEGSLSGYTHEFDAAAARAALDEVTARAKAAHIALALGTCLVEDDGQCYNEVRFYDADGNFLGFHTKTLRCGTLDNPPQGEINRYGVRPLRTFTLCGIPVGALICNDMWANPQCTPEPDPHLSRQLAKLGARVIFHAVNGGRAASEWSDMCRSFHEANLRMRARASGVWVVVADNCEPAGIRCSCPSGVVRPDGSWAIKVPMLGEQFFAETIELEPR